MVYKTLKNSFKFNNCVLNCLLSGGAFLGFVVPIMNKLTEVIPSVEFQG